MGTAKFNFAMNNFINSRRNFLNYKAYKHQIWHVCFSWLPHVKLRKRERVNMRVEDCTITSKDRDVKICI